MSGLEVLGAAASVLQLLDSAVSLVAQVRQAHERRKEFSAVLYNHTLEVTKTREIIRIVHDEKVLHTAAIASELIEIDSIARRLLAVVRTLRNDKGWTSQLLHQLVHGTKDESKLAKIMNQLDRAQSNLSLRINVAHVGLTRTIKNDIIVNTEIVERIDSVVQSVLGTGQGLRIADLVRNRPVQDKGVVTLTNTDLASLDAANTNTRIAVDNVTRDQAIQINGPVGKVEWYQVSHLTIKNNEATGQSIQINDGISAETLTLLLQARSSTPAK